MSRDDDLRETHGMATVTGVPAPIACNPTDGPPADFDDVYRGEAADIRSRYGYDIDGNLALRAAAQDQPVIPEVTARQLLRTQVRMGDKCDPGWVAEILDELDQAEASQDLFRTAIEEARRAERERIASDIAALAQHRGEIIHRPGSREAHLQRGERVGLDIARDIAIGKSNIRKPIRDDARDGVPLRADGHRPWGDS